MTISKPLTKLCHTTKQIEIDIIKGYPQKNYDIIILVVLGQSLKEI